MALLKQTSLPVVSIFDNGPAIPNNLHVISGPIDFSSGNNNFGGYARGVWILSGVMGGSPSANTAFSIYLLRSYDGVNFDTYFSSGATPPIAQSALIPANSGDNTSFVRSSTPVDSTIQTSKVILYNNGTGQKLNSGWSLQYLPITDVGI